LKNKVYVGNLPYEVEDEDLQNLFTAVGEVLSARVIRDRDTGRSKGFGFVEMATDSLAESAVSQLDGNDFQARALRVSIAREREARPGGGGGPRGGGGGGGRGGFRGGRF
jgi:RNA recognition motif-containing protein